MAFFLMGGHHPSLLSSSSSSSLLCFSLKSNDSLFRLHLLQIAHKSKSKNLFSGLVFCSSQIKVTNQRDLKLSSPFLCTQQQQHYQEEEQSISPKALFLPNLVDKVFGTPLFEASKLDVIFSGMSVDEHPEILPRIYTLTHCDITAMLTLTISQSINKTQLQGWYQRLQRDEVIAIWRKCQGTMSLHVHCHISGDHMLLETFASLRFYIFKKELPLVLEAFRHGDQALLRKYPELDQATVWVYFHSNVHKFDRVEYWGPLESRGQGIGEDLMVENLRKKPIECNVPCHCCFPKLKRKN